MKRKSFEEMKPLESVKRMIPDVSYEPPYKGAKDMALENPDMVNTIVADSFEGLSANSDITEQIRIGREYAKQNEDFRRMLKLVHGDDWESVVDADTEAIIAHAQGM